MKPKVKTPLQPLVGGGAEFNNLSPSEIKRIQNAATKTKQKIIVIGSQVLGKGSEKGQAKPTSDWDYILSGRA